MPRPGPRPYECVRRAWHSDRHQPIRGSLIQQIFRVVNEAHTAATKKNKEWQQKLPIVVLKAEEIMYSKANSEAEYTNLETLFDRVNDAINTIIRREETTETGDLLPPCVEAALNLGCVPVRASRSQRHSNPRAYLSPRAQEPPPRAADRPNDERRPQLLPFQSRNQMSLPRTPVPNSPSFRPESNAHISSWNTSLAAPENVLTGYSHDSNAPASSVYPLYYGTHYRAETYQPGARVPESAHDKRVYIGSPVVTPCSVAEPTNVVEARENRGESECDLSLRLGIFSHPFERREKSLPCNADDVDCDTRQSTNKEFCFFPGKPASDPIESDSRIWNSTGEGQSSRGKEPFSSNEDGRFCWQPGVPSNWFHS